MHFIDIITARGFVHQMTDEAGLRELLKTPGQVAYIGFDCTAKSLHVGSLLQIMLLRWWQKCGHKPIVLLGGGTTKIGDPSGKDESRPPLSDAQINENMESLREVFSRFLSFSNNESSTPANAAIMANNDDWLRGLNYVDFLRDYGRHFSINRMLTMDSVKLRLEREQTLSFLEFNYMILQAYDFVELNRRHGCRVQMGGSDQWGNIVNGVELERKLYADKHIKYMDAAAKAADTETANYATNFKLHGITSPLLTTASGAKMGKTAEGAVWLNADMLKPYDYWQFWRNTEDGDVVRFLKLFTEIPLTETDRAADTTRMWEYSLESLKAQGKLDGAAINEAKILLATEATAMLHGREAAERAAKTAAETFAGSGVSDSLPELLVDAARLDAGIAVYELLVLAGFAMSNGEARRLIKGNGVSVNDAKVSTEDLKLSARDLMTDGFIKLSAGKKRHVLVKPAK